MKNNTPDTEWEEQFESLLAIHIALQSGFHSGSNPFEDVDRAGERIKSFITHLLSSRDTYWKERVQEEVDLTKREIKHRVERYFKDAYLSLKQQGGVHIHLEAIQEIIDDSTPPGFAPTPLQDK